MKIAFHGAARGVTGSCYLVSCNGSRILIDCGLYQGPREVEEENEKPFGFDPADIEHLLLTHAHLDHCGRIPLLHRRGFRGEIITTPASRELAKLVMLDSAKLQEDEARWESRKQARKGRHKAIEPLYGTLDVLNVLDNFGRNADYNKAVKLADGITATFFDAGHILGSASILLELEEGGRNRRVLFSGDIGYSDRVILRNPAQPSDIDVVVMETTYGDRKHKALQPSIEEMYDAINSTLQRGGNVIIPSFALERAQEILYYLREGIANNTLPRHMQVFLDSPMAISATEIFRRHPECYDENTCELFSTGQDPFGFSGLHFTRETAESMALNQISGGAVIIAGSGMCTGGRVRHHLKHNLWRRDSSVIFVGYAAIGTPARRIVDGAKQVRMFNEVIPVNASIHTIGGFSAHADNEELLAWHAKTGQPDTTYLIHGEEDSMSAFAKTLTRTSISMPTLHEEYEL
jgi:metallo-beta-lactamase family protein